MFFIFNSSFLSFKRPLALLLSFVLMFYPLSANPMNSASLAPSHSLREVSSVPIPSPSLPSLMPVSQDEIPAKMAQAEQSPATNALNPAQALPLIPDISQSNTSLDLAPNGVDIINIASPNAEGISNNFFLEFNVKNQGAIFNNSLEAMTPTQLAGLIVGNPHLESSASLILNQVTSTSPSSLLGLMEIAGKEASLLIANPNGISCKGCGFINTKDAILTTGTLSLDPFLASKNVSSFSPSVDPSLLSSLAPALHLRVQKGQINIDSLDALKSQSLSLLSNSLKINGELYAKELKVLLGSNEIGLDQKGALLLWQPLKLSQNNALALDVGYLGRVYANSIFIVASAENSVFHHAGLLATLPSKTKGDGGFYLDINGEIKIAKTQTPNLANDVSASYSNASISSSLSNAINQNPSSSASSLSNPSSSSGSNLFSTNEANASLPALYSSNALWLKSKKLNNEGLILSQSEMKLLGDEIKNASIIATQDHLNIQAHTLLNLSLLQGQNISLKAEILKNNQGFILSNYDLKIQAKHLFNLANLILKKQEISQKNIKSERWKKRDECLSKGRFWDCLFYGLNHGDKNYQERIIEEAVESYSPSVLYAKNTLFIQAEQLDNHNGQIIGEKQSDLSQSGVINLKATQAERKVIHRGEEARYYTVRVRCAWYDFFRCKHKNETRFGIFNYNRQWDSKIALSLPELKDNLLKAPQFNAFNPYLAFSPTLRKHQTFSLKEFQNFSQSAYFLKRFDSLPANQKERFLASLSNSGLKAILEDFNHLQDISLKAFAFTPFSSIQTHSTFSGNLGGENIAIQARVLNNDGSIIAQKSIFINTEKALQNKGAFFADQIALNSQGEISNLGGTIQAKENLSLQAKSISLSSSIQTKENTNFKQSSLYAQGFLKAKNLSLKATEGLNVLATELQAQENLSLNAQTIHLNALSLEQNTQDSAFYSSNSSLIQSSLKAGNLSLKAKNISSTASNFEAKETLSLQAQNIALLSAKEESKTSSVFYSSASWFGSKRKESNFYQANSIGNALQAKTLNINAQDHALLLGVNLKAKEEINLKARNLLLVNGTDLQTSFSSQEKNQLWGLKNKTTSLQESSSNARLSQLEAKNIHLQTSNDLKIIGASLKAENASLIAGGNLSLSNAFNQKNTISQTSSRDFKGLYANFDRKFSTGLEFETKGEKISTFQTQSIASVLNVQNNLTLEAKEHLNIIGSDLVANEIQAQAKQVNILSAEETYIQNVQSTKGTLQMGIEIGNAYVDAYYAGKDAYQAGQKVKQSAEALKIAQKAYEEGKITQEALEDYKINLVASSLSLASASSNLVGAIRGAATSVATSFGTGFYASLSAKHQETLTHSSEKNINQASSHLNAKNIQLRSLNNITQTSSHLLAQKVSYIAGGEVILNAKANTQEQQSQTSSRSISTSIGTKGWEGLNTSFMQGKSQFKSKSYVGSQTLAQNISIQSNQVSLEGSKLLSQTSKISAKDLKLTSLVDTSSFQAKESDLSVGIGTTTSFSKGEQKANQTTEQVKAQAGIFALHSSQINLSNSLTLKGAKIALLNEGSLSISAPKIKLSEIQTKEEENTKGFNLSSSLTKDPQSLLKPSGNTDFTINHQSKIKETITFSSIGSSNPTQASITINQIQQQDKTLKTKLVTKDQITYALNAKLSIDNRLLAQAGREEILNDIKELVHNLVFIGETLAYENALSQITSNFLNKPKEGITSAFQSYFKTYEDVKDNITSDVSLNAKLNGLTHLNPQELQQSFQTISHRIDEDKKANQGRKVHLYNNETTTKGYAYQDKTNPKLNHIGFNTRSNDLTKPKEVINTLYHETSSKAKHHQDQINHNDAYAIQRGKNAQSAYHFLNYGNKNTNSLSTEEWNQKHSNSPILKQGNANNLLSWGKDIKAEGERDNFIGRLIPLVVKTLKQAANQVKKAENQAAKQTEKQVAKPGKNPDNKPTNQGEVKNQQGGKEPNKPKPQKLNISKQNKHIEGTNESNIAKKNNDIKSPITEDLSFIEDFVRKYGTGKQKEVLDFGRKIGIYINRNTKKSYPTTMGRVHYDQNGNFHVVPAPPKGGSL